MNKKNGVKPIVILILALIPPFSAAAMVNSRSTPPMGPLAGKANGILIQMILSDSQAYKVATDSIIAYFKNELLSMKLFIDTYGELAWEDVSEEVIDSIDIVRDRKMERERYGDKQFAFTGFVFDLYTEVVIDKATGVVMKMIIELE